MTDFRKVLLAVCPYGKPEIIDGFAMAMQSCIDYADLSTPERLACFIGQCAEESASFQTTIEYASGRAYDGRRDLGNVEPGDGPRFKGRGLIQITGRANYAAASQEMGVDFVAHPELMAAFPYAAWAADRYWKTHNLNVWADKMNVREITHRVNGGFNGLALREAFTRKALAALKDLRGTLIQTAHEEKAKATAKTVGASITAIPGAVASTIAAHPAASANSHLWIVGVVVGIAAIGAAVLLFLSIRKHEDAAKILLDAAKNA